MDFLDMIAAVDREWDRAFLKVFCSHNWEYQRTVREQNLRGGYAHDSELYKCVVCEKWKTVELPPAE